MENHHVSHYRLVRRLGAGGMGEVFLAEDTRLERAVALKVMSAELAKDENQRKRFRAEAKAASALAHPNICVIHEVGETDDARPFLAMEYVEGETLDEILKQRRLRMREIISLGLETSEALQAAHARGLVHRDIKPANIMLDQRGHAKVLDFGLAKRFAQDELSASAASEANTRTGMLIGTPHYMSPEQVLGRELDPRSDIFSLGAVLYELVAGQRPFGGRTIGETINNVVNQTPEPLGLENPLFTPALDQIIFRCLEKEPQNRYPTAKALAKDLARLRNEAERLAAAKTGVLASPPAPMDPSIAAARAEQAVVARGGRTGVAVAAVAAALLLLAGIALWPTLSGRNAGGSNTPDAGNAAPPNSVAVLPFDNLTGEADSDYLSDGLTEEITTALSRIQGLKVAARNSAFTFKGKKQDARAVGRALRVNALLEGSIRKAGKQVRVTAQLISVADGFQLWSDTFDRPLDDIVGVQDEIARRIAERLGGPAQVAARPSTVDPEAHAAYLRARLFWNRRTEAGLKRAAQLFQEAVAKAPSYGAAHAGLASTYYLMPQYSVSARQSQYHPLARASATRALELDSSSAEAHAVLASLHAAAHDANGAEEHFRRAIQLQPSYATAHHWYGVFLVVRARREEAWSELRKAVELDPFSPIIQTAITHWYYLGRDYDRAIEEARKVIDAFPEFPAARHTLTAALLQSGRYKEALAEIDKSRALQADEPLAELEKRGYALARSGDRAEAEKILSVLEEQRQQGKPLDGAIGFVWLGLKNYDRAIEALEREQASEGLDDELLSDPFFDELRNLPRLQALLRKSGLTSS